jgi:hypothetical protein
MQRLMGSVYTTHIKKVTREEVWPSACPPSSVHVEVTNHYS